MKKYLGKAKDLTTTFQGFNIWQVLRAENAKTNALSKLLPSEATKKGG